MQVATAASTHEFFAATAGVAGALIGLLFVAISVAPDRVIGPEASEVHSVRAVAALTAFTNALTVSLFELAPGLSGGGAPISVAILGLLFIFGALIGLAPSTRLGHVKLGDISFLVGLLVVFVLQLLAGIDLERHAADSGGLRTICVLVIVCFLLGIARAWELVGGPKIGLWHALHAQHDSTDGPDGTGRHGGSDEDQRSGNSRNQPDDPEAAPMPTDAPRS
jgi:hypothetical protein